GVAMKDPARLLAGFKIPQANIHTVTGGHRELRLLTIGHRADVKSTERVAREVEPPPVTGVDADRLPSLQIPLMHPPRRVAGQGLALRAEGDAHHRVGMALVLAQLLAGLRVPQADGMVAVFRLAFRPDVGLSVATA